MLAGCVAAAAAAYHYLPSISESSSAATADLLPEHPSAMRAEALSRRLFRFPLLTPYVLVQRDPGELPASAAADAYANAERASTGALPGLHGLAAAVPVSNTAGLFPAAREHGTTIITYLYFGPGGTARADVRLAQRYAALFPPEDHVVGVTGALPARLDQYDQIQSHLHLVELATLAGILLIVGLALRAVLAPLLVVAAAGLAFVASQRVLGWLSVHSGMTMPRELTAVSVALMLGVVTDYSVFLLAGARRRLATGMPRSRAVREAVAVVAPIVLVAGLLVACGVATLAFGTLGFFRSLGPGMAITVVAGLVVSLTFVPAGLALLGRAAFWPGLSSTWTPRLHGRLATRVLSLRPVALAVSVAVLALLVLMATGLGRIALGAALVGALPPNDPVARAGAAAGDGFASGILAPTEAIVRLPGIAARRPALASLQHALGAEPHVAGVLGPVEQPSAHRLGVFLSRDGGAARFVLVFDSEPTDAPAIGALRRVERDMPARLARAGIAGAQVDYSGETALALDADNAIVASLWRIALAVFAVNLVFLAIFLRALVAPLYLLLASALALAATFGATTWVFEGLLGYGGVTYYLPVAIGVLLVSLGSDYNLFVVGRVWQEAQRRPLRDAVRVAAPRASRAIGIAGIAMALSFALLALVPLRPFRLFAFAMAFGILLDALLVRSVLVPGLVVAFGRLGFWPGSRRVAPVPAEPVPDVAPQDAREEGPDTRV